MSKALVFGLLISSLLLSISTASDNGFSRCDCNEDGFWSIEMIMECQKVSDFLIAVAYFSIPIELLYFVSCSNVPFKWVLFQFIAFIVLCGMTHLLNGWTYGPHPFQLMLALTIFKFLTALVSFATAITLITLIPMLLKVKTREFMLKKKTWDLGREVGIIRRKNEAGLHVRMLTQEIRKSLDRHTILYTTLDELSKTLDLRYCAVWMPNEGKTEMNLTHELKGRNISDVYNLSIPINDPDVQLIKGSKDVKLLERDSPLVTGSVTETGPIAAIRMPMLRVCNFKGGTPELIQACYSILVLVLPGGEGRSWRSQELEIVTVVADQVAVALSHSAILEESQFMRDKLVEQNRALQQAKQNAMMASQARNSFQKVMSDGMRKPMHSILGLLSIMQEESQTVHQTILVDSMLKTSNVLMTLINDVMDMSAKENGRFPLEVRSFRLHSTIREAACVTKCLCVSKGFGFIVNVGKSLPNYVMGDERRVFQVILHMVGNLLERCNGRGGGGNVILQVFSESESQGSNDPKWSKWRANTSDGYVCVRFEIGINRNSGSHPGSGSGSSMVRYSGRKYSSESIEESLSFNLCRKLAQMMQGNIWMVQNPEGFEQSMTLVLRFQIRPSIVLGLSETGESSTDHPNSSNSLFRGLQILLVHNDIINTAVTKKLLQKLGCTVTTVSTGYECLSALGSSVSSFQIVLLDLQLSDINGLDVAIRIRKFRSRNWPLIIAMSARVDEDVWSRCLQIGINGVVQMPMVLQGIAAELRRTLLKANKGM
ncbi:protein EIN4-like [Impatiens glandulifera]|uniref:protein EIN4-like n=1 Tax=Impatiens glandulifera TaxID=253017 RepID=UPI001FB134A5|nr:protein EIN4-like [Impatiens glandulifera]